MVEANDGDELHQLIGQLAYSSRWIGSAEDGKLIDHGEVELIALHGEDREIGAFIINLGLLLFGIFLIFTFSFWSIVGFIAAAIGGFNVRDVYNKNVNRKYFANIHTSDKDSGIFGIYIGTDRAAIEAVRAKLNEIYERGLGGPRKKDVGPVARWL
jgi:hypothetical protein